MYLINKYDDQKLVNYINFDDELNNVLNNYSVACSKWSKIGKVVN